MIQQREAFVHMKLRKCKIGSISLILILLCSMWGGLSVSADFQPPFTVNSEAAYMVSLDTDTVIYAKNEQQRVYPASLTKIMTLILLLENVDDLSGTYVTAPYALFDEFANVGASTADIWPGETVNMQDLAYGLMLRSACEAANIIGWYVGGESLENFFTMMNEKAKEIGAVNTHFVNAHGLFDENHYTTAYDMYLITRYAIDHVPLFEDISCAKSWTMEATDVHPEERVIYHTNTMLDQGRGGEYYYPYVRGIKTGTLPESGRNLATMGSKNGYSYLLLTLGAPQYDENGNQYAENLAYEDQINLYNWAFDGFQYTTVVSEGEDIMEFAVEQASDKDYVLLKAKTEFGTLLPTNIDKTSVQRILPEKQTLIAPIEAGTVLGQMELRFEGETLTTIDLVAAESIERSEMLYILDKLKILLDSGWFKIAAITLGILVIFYIILFSVLNRRRKKLKQVKKKRKF